MSYSIKIILSIVAIILGWILNKMAWAGELAPADTLGSLGLVFGVIFMIGGIVMLIKTVIEDK